jgi:hypothetical protein
LKYSDSAMSSPRIITSIPQDALEKLQCIAKKKSLSVSSMSRMLLVEKLASIPEEDSAMKSPGGMPND